MIDAAKLANGIDGPLNRILTVRTSGIILSGGGGILRNSGPADRVTDLLEKIARWCRYRGIPVSSIWVREYGNHRKDHLHIGYHMPPLYDAAFAQQLALWLDEDIGILPEDKPATIASSELRSWQIDGCIKGGTSGRHIAAYLGKSEPNYYFTGWGKRRRNDEKAVRKAGGFGPIEGTLKHHCRWGTSDALGPTQRSRYPEYVN
jgi:hypothetical protein